MVRHTTQSRDSIISEFLAGQTERVYAYGRLYTRDAPDGEGIQLVAYGENIIAELDGDTLTFYTGHHQQVSSTVTRYVKRFGSVLSTGEYSDLTVNVTTEAPQTGYKHRAIMAQAAQYISNYLSDFERTLSDVEQDAIEDVEDALLEVLDLEFGE